MERRLGAAYNLREMVLLMPHIIFNEELKRDGLAVVHATHCTKPLFGDSIHDGHQNLVLCRPPKQEIVPGLFRVAVSGNPCSLPVARPRILSVN